MYEKMTGVLEGSGWDTIGAIRERGNVYIYKFVRNGFGVRGSAIQLTSFFRKYRTHQSINRPAA